MCSAEAQACIPTGTLFRWEEHRLAMGGNQRMDGLMSGQCRTKETSNSVMPPPCRNWMSPCRPNLIRSIPCGRQFLFGSRYDESLSRREIKGSYHLLRLLPPFTEHGLSNRPLKTLPRVLCWYATTTNQVCRWCWTTTTCTHYTLATTSPMHPHPVLVHCRTAPQDKGGFSLRQGSDAEPHV